MTTIAERVAHLDWTRTASDLDTQGWAVLPTLPTPDECDQDRRALRTRRRAYCSHETWGFLNCIWRRGAIGA